MAKVWHCFGIVLGALFLAAAEVHAAVYVTATVTVTNATSNGNSITVNANTRTWTNTVTAAPSSLILNGASIGAVTTNLYQHIAKYPYSSPLVDLRWVATNQIILTSQADQALAVSLGGSWATLSLVTNTYTNTWVIRTPMENSGYATNIASLGLKDLTEKSTNAVSASSSSMGNFVNTSTDQSIAGVKSFTDPLTVKSYLLMTNDLPTISFYDTGAGTATDEHWAVMNSYGGNFNLYFYSDDGMTQTPVFDIGRDGTTPTAITFWEPIYASTIHDCTITNSFITNSVINSGTFDGTVVALTNGLWVNAAVTNLVSTNATFKGTNNFTGDVAFTRANHSSLANGNNAGIDFGTTAFVKIKAGPTGAFTLNGIAGGRDGRRLVIYNSTAQNMTVANDSGVDPTPANRIYTLTGGDITSTGTGAVELVYDSEDSRWIVVAWTP